MNNTPYGANRIAIGLRTDNLLIQDLLAKPTLPSSVSKVSMLGILLGMTLPNGHRALLVTGDTPELVNLAGRVAANPTRHTLD